VRSEIVVPLVVRDLTEADLPGCGWSGSRLHLEHVARELVRVHRGEAEYLAVCAARSGLPVGKGIVDYRKSAGAGTIGQPAVHAGEDRIRARGEPNWASKWTIRAHGRCTSGSIRRYETTCVLLRKTL
jgi:hypothetical protein